MTEIVVSSQEELVKALHNADIRIIRIKASKDFNIPYGKWEEKGKRILVYGRATVEADDRAEVMAGAYVPVHILSEQVSVVGGMQILVEPTKTISPKQWCAVNIITVDDDGMAHLYKAVDKDGRSPRGGLYIIGDTTDDTEHWLDTRKCGRGLHASPTPKMAREYFEEATRFFEVTCPVEDLRPIDNTKCKAPRLHVLREVNIYGRPIDGEGDRR